MKRLVKPLAWIAVVLAVGLAAGITFTIGWRPFIGPRTRPLTARKFESTPARLARGEYLVNHVMDCMGCHSEHDWTTPDAALLAGTLGAGQDMTSVKGLPGRVYAPNITPDPESGAGNWTDDQLARGIREGISHDGRALFAFMPYEDFRALSDEDLASIIVYLRSLPPVRKQWPQTDLIFPINYLMREVPRPVNAPVPEPDISTPEKRGEYLLTIAGCSDCHTPQDAHGQRLPEMKFAGGFIMDGPWGRVATSNITSDPSTGIDEANFLQAMAAGYAKGRRLNQVMPWRAYRGMTGEDIAAIFASLKTITPVRHFVDNTLPPSYCKLCRQSHGGGNQN